MAPRTLMPMLVAAILFVGASHPVMAVAAPDQVDLGEYIDGALARSESILSGRIKYTLWSNLRPDRTDAFVLVFSASSWRLDEPAFQVTRVNHHGAFAEINRNRQKSGLTRDSARFSSETPIDYRSPAPPYFAGSFWYRGTNATADYIKQHRSEVKFAGKENVNNIACAILDWKVPKDDRWAAFNTTISSLDNGGVLRLYVSKDLGFVLPRIDNLTPEGEVAQRYECSDFRDVGAGVFFPTELYEETFPGQGQTGYRLEYKIQSAENINESISDDAFIVKLQPSTSVTDARGATPVHYVVGDLSEDVAKIAKIDSSKVSKRRWGGALGRGGVIGLNILIITALVSWSLWKRRSSTPGPQV